jgi:hypothetical protein
MSASATAFLESSHGFVSGRKCIRDFVFPKAAMAFGGILLAATTLGVVIRNGKAGVYDFAAISLRLR